jgi:sRNA-binding protein
MLAIQERENRRRQKALRAAQKKREEEEAAAAAAQKEVALGDRRRQKAAVLEREPEPGPGVTSVRLFSVSFASNQVLKQGNVMLTLVSILIQPQGLQAPL